MCTLVPISLTVGANRIVPTIAIPHPLGNPSLIKKKKKNLRRKLVGKSIKSSKTEVEGKQYLKIRKYNKWSDT